ncbi:hypothetical protein B0J13DRAFT_133044 [Dactylonectria estremocensis]|uniref:Extracellular membrane protein CFEM domain-containing protein n=1 Tax=Dactylonectria estremocensis TaxID=1079267 RepID=A0A9P9IQY0_9HYPO|nr:hypothetical protein B0J13DRAFT_133044 [Dactylonectria estremocensis]
MAPRSLWSCLALCLALAPISTLSAATNDFSFYPDNAENCLNKSADAAACTGDTNQELNDCLCSNTNDFVTNTAKCLGSEDPDDVDEVYTTMKSACSASQSNFTVTEAEWNAAAAEGGSSISSVPASSSTASSSSTESATSSATGSSSDLPTIIAATTTTSQSAFVTTTSGGKTITVYPTETSDDHDHKSGLSTPVTIGIGVGGAVLGAAIVGFVFCILLRRRKKGGEESRPMLSDPQPQQHGGNVPFAQSVAYQDNKPAWTPGGADGKGWGAPTAYTGAAGAYPPPGYTPGLPPQQGVAPGTVFEMEGSVATQAVEMPGSVVHGGQPVQHQQGWRHS